MRNGEGKKKEEKCGSPASVFVAADKGVNIGRLWRIASAFRKEVFRYGCLKCCLVYSFAISHYGTCMLFSSCLSILILFFPKQEMTDIYFPTAKSYWSKVLKNEKGGPTKLSNIGSNLELISSAETEILTKASPNC